MCSIALVQYAGSMSDESARFLCTSETMKHLKHSVSLLRHGNGFIIFLFQQIFVKQMFRNVRKEKCMYVDTDCALN